MNQQDQVVIDRLHDTVREMESYIREEYCTDYDDFLENDILKRAVAMCLISADQLIASLSDAFITEHQRMIFARFTTLRYIAERRYHALDFYALWVAATQELPAFLNELFSAAGMEAPAKRLGQAQVQAREELRPPMQEPFQTQMQTRPAVPPQYQAPPPIQPAQEYTGAPGSGGSKNQEPRQPFVMNELYKRQAYNQMMQMNMSKEEAAVETKKEVNTLLEMLEKEKRSRGL